MKKTILLIAAGICGFAPASHASLVAWFKFDEEVGASIAANSVVGSADGVILATGTGSVTTGVAGVSGNAYQFTLGDTANTGGYVDMFNANFLSSITASGQLTISAWINTTTTTGNRNVAVFAGSDLATQTYVDLGYSGTGTGAPAGAGAGAGAGSAYTRSRPNNINSGPGVTGAWSNTASGVVNDGEWQHIVMTLTAGVGTDPGLLSIFLNGVFQNVQALPEPNNGLPTFNNFEIGRLGRGNPVDYYSGLIDEVQVYDMVLSDIDIQFLYENPGLAVPEPGAIALAGLGLGVLYVASRRKRRA